MILGGYNSAREINKWYVEFEGASLFRCVADGFIEIAPR